MLEKGINEIMMLMKNEERKIIKIDVWTDLKGKQTTIVLTMDGY
jgi:hypothetical protein